VTEVPALRTREFAISCPDLPRHAIPIRCPAKARAESVVGHRHHHMAIEGDLVEEATNLLLVDATHEDGHRRGEVELVPCRAIECDEAPARQCEVHSRAPCIVVDHPLSA